MSGGWKNNLELVFKNALLVRIDNNLERDHQWFTHLDKRTVKSLSTTGWKSYTSHPSLFRFRQIWCRFGAYVHRRVRMCGCVVVQQIYFDAKCHYCFGFHHLIKVFI